MIRATTGGGAFAITASETTVDLLAIQGCVVAIYSTDQNILICGSDVSPGPALVTGATAASLTSAKAEQVGKGTKAFRLIEKRYMTHKTDTGSGTIHYKVVEKPIVTGINGF